jgi:hypothetical protein
MGAFPLYINLLIKKKRLGLYNKPLNQNQLGHLISLVGNSEKVPAIHCSKILVHDLAGVLKIRKSSEGLLLFCAPYKQRTCVLNTLMCLK